MYSGNCATAHAKTAIIRMNQIAVPILRVLCVIRLQSLRGPTKKAVAMSAIKLPRMYNIANILIFFAVYPPKSTIVEQREIVYPRATQQQKPIIRSFIESFGHISQISSSMVRGFSTTPIV